MQVSLIIHCCPVSVLVVSEVKLSSSITVGSRRVAEVNAAYYDFKIDGRNVLIV